MLAIQKTNALNAWGAKKLAKEKTTEKADDEKQKWVATKVLGKTVPMGGMKKPHHSRLVIMDLHEIRRYQQSMELIVRRIPF